MYKLARFYHYFRQRHFLAFAQRKKLFSCFVTKTESEENENKDCAMKIEFILFSAALLNKKKSIRFYMQLIKNLIAGTPVLTPDLQQGRTTQSQILTELK